MIDQHGSPLIVLLLHNALAVVIAALLAPHIRPRVLVAVISLAIAFAVLCGLVNTNAVAELGWWLFVQEPMLSFHDPDLFGTRRSPELFVTFGLMTLVVSPFVFAYFTAWQWAGQGETSQQRVRGRQIRLKCFLIGIAIGCLFLGVRSWMMTGRIVAYPMVILAILLMIRPVRFYSSFRQRIENNKRLTEIRRGQLQIDISNCVDPTDRTDPSDQTDRETSPKASPSYGRYSSIQ